MNSIISSIQITIGTIGFVIAVLTIMVLSQGF
jgi:preprotein translocase subunit Sss1